MGRLRLVGALVKVAAELYSFERIEPEKACRNADAHAPAYEIPDNAGNLLVALDLRYLRAAEERAVFAVGAVSRQQVAAASRFEVEVFACVCGVLQEYLDAGIFPAVAAIFQDFAAEAVDGFFDGKVHLEKVAGECRVRHDGRQCDPLVCGPVHIRF